MDQAVQIREGTVQATTKSNAAGFLKGLFLPCLCVCHQLGLRVATPHYSHLVYQTSPQPLMTCVSSRFSNSTLQHSSAHAATALFAIQGCCPAKASTSKQHPHQQLLLLLLLGAATAITAAVRATSCVQTAIVAPSFLEVISHRQNSCQLARYGLLLIASRTLPCASRVEWDPT